MKQAGADIFVPGQHGHVDLHYILYCSPCVPPIHPTAHVRKSWDGISFQITADLARGTLSFAQIHSCLRHELLFRANHQSSRHADICVRDYMLLFS